MRALPGQERGVEIVVFGLGVSSSWGNGHATLWRGLGRALEARGHTLVFFERDVPYYAAHRDGTAFPGIEVVFYRDLAELVPRAATRLANADVAMVTSFCPEGRAVSALVLDSPVPLRVFYDLDTPVTLAALEAGRDVDYLPAEGLGDFDLVLSFAGGRALDELSLRLGARRVAPLYGSVDPAVHRPAAARPGLSADLSYLGTYSADRQDALAELLLAPATRAPRKRFVIAGAMYPESFPWRANVHFVHHLPPADHAAFFASAPLTLNVTRAPMVALGHCPSGRLFEAAACGAVIVTDTWDGLERFFTPGSEVLPARRAEDVLAALSLGPGELAQISLRARERALDEHTAAHRAAELETLLVDASIGPVPIAAGGE
jgi:spore maturation protein CgeB